MQKHELFLGYEGTQAAMLEGAPSIHDKSIEELVVMLGQAGVPIDTLRSEKRISYKGGCSDLPLQAHIGNLDHKILNYTLKTSGSAKTDISIYMFDIENDKLHVSEHQSPTPLLRSGVRCKIDIAKAQEANVDSELRTLSKVLKEFYMD